MEEEAEAVVGELEVGARGDEGARGGEEGGGGGGEGEGEGVVEVERGWGWGLGGGDQGFR